MLDTNFKFNLPFEYLLPNLVLSILVANELEVSKKEIQKSLNQIDQLPLNIEYFETKDYKVLNDSYSLISKDLSMQLNFQRI